MTLWTWLLVGFSLFVGLICYSACVVAGRADEKIEKYFRGGTR